MKDYLAILIVVVVIIGSLMTGNKPKRRHKPFKDSGKFGY